MSAGTWVPRAGFAMLALGLVFAGCQLVSGSDGFEFVPGATGAPGAGGGGSGGDGASEGGGGSNEGGEGGTAAECAQPEECPGIESTCLRRACDDGVCGQEPAPADSLCTEIADGVCNGNGACVECTNALAHCESGEECVQQICVPATCFNDGIDGEETGLDCGGTMCAPCANDEGCNGRDDCTSGVCDTSGGGGGGGAGGATAAGVCVACGTNDCEAEEWCSGGACVPKKPQGDSCTNPVQCQNGICVEGVCCDGACDTNCWSCLGFHTGGETGTCDHISMGQDPYNECLLGLVCNGDGGCL